MTGIFPPPSPASGGHSRIKPGFYALIYLENVIAYYVHETCFERAGETNLTQSRREETKGNPWQGGEFSMEILLRTCGAGFIYFFNRNLTLVLFTRFLKMSNW